jgi:hypothetical protein
MGQRQVKAGPPVADPNVNVVEGGRLQADEGFTWGNLRIRQVTVFEDFRAPVPGKVDGLQDWHLRN